MNGDPDRRPVFAAAQDGYYHRGPLLESNGGEAGRRRSCRRILGNVNRSSHAAGLLIAPLVTYVDSVPRDAAHNYATGHYPRLVFGTAVNEELHRYSGSEVGATKNVHSTSRTVEGGRVQYTSGRCKSDGNITRTGSCVVA